MQMSSEWILDFRQIANALIERNEPATHSSGRITV
jgi:hypothetical protein